MKNKTAKREYKAHLRSFRKPWAQRKLFGFEAWFRDNTMPDGSLKGSKWYTWSEDGTRLVEVEPKEVFIELTMPSYSAQLTMPDDNA